MTKDVYIAQSSAIAARVLGAGAVIMAGETSSVFSLNVVATAIWEAADGITPLREIVSRVVCKEFDVDPETALRDAEEFVRGLATHGILEVREQPFSP